MKGKLPVILLGVIAAALIWQVTAHRPKPEVVSVSSSRPSPAETTRPASLPSEPVTAEETPRSGEGLKSGSTETSGLSHERAETSAPEHSARSASLETIEGPEVAQGLSPAIVLENMRSAFRQFSLRFGGNPVGTNPEITAALNGKNPRHVVFVDPEAGMRINERGELVDNWGTAFFFHQLSGTVIEIRSAGPDRKMWSSDDLLIK